MEPPVVRSRGRPRKRRREEDEMDAHDRSLGLESKRQAVLAKPIVLVGRYVLKEFKRNEVFLGKVVYYDTGLYRVNYEDGDFEDLESGQIRRILLRDIDFDDDLTQRRIKLDALVLQCDVLIGNESKKPPSSNAYVDVSKANVSELNELSGESSNEHDEEQVESDDDSSSDSCEEAKGSGQDLNPLAISIPQLQLLPSSGTIGVPEQYVSHLLSVYGFLRSFSVRLFLTPFSLDEFVGSLNCCLKNTLIDAIHVSLLRGLRSHLEMLSSASSEIASNCLRYSDWSLLDILTWPIYVVQYLTINGYIKGTEWDGFYDEVFNREYYLLAVGRKLMILQILCDDVLDFAELRIEFDMRELAEVGSAEAEVIFAPENGPRRVHPRNAKTSACRDRDSLNMISEPLDLKDSNGSADADADKNGDECRLCGMDGTLLCCDGCPSAYHSRCIGVMKSFIPPGRWYCPECKTNNAGPTIAKGTCLRGAVTFGMDIYGHFFIASCDHLLIIKPSGDGEFCVRYYNKNDIPKVLQVLCSSPQHRALYFDICQAILLYWNFSESLFSLREITGADSCFTSERKDEDLSSLLVSFVDKEDHRVAYMGGVENSESTVNESKDDNIVSCHDSSLGSIKNEPSGPEIYGEFKNQGCAVLNNKPPEGIRLESSFSTGSRSCQTDMLKLMHDARSSAQDQSICTSFSSGESLHSCPNGTSLPVSEPSKYEEAGYENSDPSLVDCYVYTGSSFKLNSYINYYVHGDLAASAAGKFEAISSEESRISSSDNSRKTASVIIALQAKAFSLTASRFFWPTFEKKLVEVPRERCGWCFSCKAPVSSKRGCMLNHAALSTTKGTMKVLSGLRPVRNGEGNLPSIVTYLIYIEESLHGLTVGPFRSVSFREQWRKHAEQVTTCSALKHLLLHLEQNVRAIALSFDWVRMVDDWFIESSTIQNSACTVGVGAANRRGPNSRRNRKHATIEEVMADDSNDTNFFWCKGGKLSKFLFQRAVLPRSFVRKAALQGGLRKISGIDYADRSELPRRSRQLVWRSAVEMSKNTSQLALQVRYFDFYLRWSDLIHPEQNGHDGKGPETEASAFRNAVISDKKLVENKILYAVSFGSQKHLPSRVIKNIVETEKSLGDEKYWFSESCIPLYLIKEYEIRADKPQSSEELLTFVPKLQSRKWRPMCKNIFFYLACKRDNLDICYCSACQLAVPVRDTVKCSACEGYCHRECSVSSTVSTNEEVEPLFKCKRCYEAKIFSQNETSNESPTSTLVFHGQGPNLVSTAKFTKIKIYNQTRSQDTPPVSNLTTKNQCKQKVASVSDLETKSKCRDQDPSDSSVSAKRRRRPGSWGIIWRKKNVDNDGSDFRLKNILTRGSSDAHHVEPICLLCRKPYRSDLMYICCEKCKNWYHADAVELEESNFFDVVGFKCCKCRRIKSPVCPYSDPKNKNLHDGRKIHVRSLQQEQYGVDSDSGIISDYKESEPATPMFPGEEVTGQDNDHLFFSLESVELVTEPGPQKLPVRRYLKREGDAAFETGLETYHLNPAEEVSSYNAEDGDINPMNDCEYVNYDDMEFEPNTYFSVTELLEQDDGDPLSEVDTSGIVPQYALSENGISEQCEIGIDSKRSEHLSVQGSIPQCWRCSLNEPSPDLSCGICGLWIHNQCSPWEESSSVLGCWRCGNCREWS